MFHDSEIIGIKVDGDEARLTVELVDVKGRVLSLAFKECIILRATDLALQNIVSKAEFFDRYQELEDKRLRNLIDWMTSGENEGSYLTNERREGFVDLFRRGDATIAHFDPSIGVEICVLYRGDFENESRLG